MTFFHKVSCSITFNYFISCKLFIVLLLLISHQKNVLTAKSDNLPESRANQLHEPEAKCTFSVHEKGPNGPAIGGTSLDQELYYKIKCEPEPGYCLRISNCSVSTGVADQKPYLIIDGRGCTTEPSLFEHVQIRFRGQKSAAVQFVCSTTLSPSGAGGGCQRETCTWNEFSREANTKIEKS